MVCWQLTVGWTVRGADRFRLCTFRFHHLAERDQSRFIFGDEAQMLQNLIEHLPRLLHHDVLLPEEAFLDHPLVTQEL